MYEIDELTISPKPPSSGMTTDYSVLSYIFEKLKDRNSNHHVSLKIVVLIKRITIMLNKFTIDIQ